MKILVFDDSRIHRVSAYLTLKDHDVTIVGTYNEAQDALIVKTDDAKQKELLAQLLEEAGLPADFNRFAEDVDEDDKAKYYKASEASWEMAEIYPDFDVVLTDLLVPASRQAQGDAGMKYVGQEMPLGTTIALLALTVGVKNVAVVTDMNHHNHPASAAFDGFAQVGSKLEGIRLLCTNSVGTICIDEETSQAVDKEFLESDEGKRKYPFKEETWGPRRGIVRGKDWGSVLKELLGEVEFFKQQTPD